MAAIWVAHPAKPINDVVSDYYIAEEISTTAGGMLLIVPKPEWNLFVKGTLATMVVMQCE